jgi:hypothetical protein
MTVKLTSVVSLHILHACRTYIYASLYYKERKQLKTFLTQLGPPYPYGRPIRHMFLGVDNVKGLLLTVNFRQPTVLVIHWFRL